MKKRIIAFTLAMVLMFSLAVTVSAIADTVQAQLTYRNIKITMDGETVNSKDANGKSVEPFIIDGTTYLPVRAVAEALGLDVGWNASTNTVSLTSGSSDNVSVYITRTGSKYHDDSTCNGGTYWPVSIETATGMGLTPCSKCVG